MDSIKTIPYGISDFALLRESKGYFVDRTHLIPELERVRYIMFLRPRRFGKSLFTSILQCYYDISYAGRFDELFAGTSIHDKPTGEHNTYLVLDFNFSAVERNVERVQDSFNEYCSERIDRFTRAYKNELPEDAIQAVQKAGNAHGKLTSLAINLKGTGIKLYVLIDEYDNFTNTILAEHGLDAYSRLCHGDGFFKQFFNELKAAATGLDAPITRMFITGVSPVTIDDVTSGFNIAVNLSDNDRLTDLLGFCHDEIRGMLDYYAQAGTLLLDKDVVFNLMTEWYDNYRFSLESPRKVINPTLVLGFMLSAWGKKSMPNYLYDENLRTDYAKLRHLVTIDRKLNGNFHALEGILTEGGCSSKLIRSFQAKELTKKDYFISLLYYFGMLSIAGDDFGDTLFTIPNKTVEMFMNTFITDGYKDVYEIDARLGELGGRLVRLAKNGEWKPVWETISSVVSQCFSARDAIEGEKAVQAMATALLTVTSGAFIVGSELGVNGGYMDISLAPFLLKYPGIRYGCIIELKYLKKGEKADARTLDRLRKEAVRQLDQYAADKGLARLWQLKPEGQVELIKLAVVFHGGDMVLCERV